MAPSAARPRNRPFIIVCVMAATIMQALDTTVANVALPYMQGALGASRDQVTWVLTSYVVASAIMTAPVGWLAGRFGRKPVMVIGVAGFTLASALCGLAGSIEQMVLFRLLQGVFGAVLVPLSQAIMLDLFPRDQSSRAIAIWSAGVMLGPILGPSVGGWLTEYYSWRWVFLVNVPIGILTAFGLLTALARPARAATPRFDWPGFLLLSLAVAALQMMLDRGEQLDWFQAGEIIAEAVLAGLAFYLFLVHSVFSDKPFISPALFRDRNLVTGLVFNFMVGMVLLSTMALMVPFMQNLMNYPVVLAGEVMAPRGIGTMAAMLLVGRLGNRADPRILITVGIVLMALALYEMSLFTPDVSAWALIRTGLVQGVALGFTFAPATAITFATLDGALRNEGAAIANLVRNMGSAIGISLTTFMLIRLTTTNHAELATALTPFNEALTAPAIARVWDLHTVVGRALLDGEVTRQAQIIAYADDFRLLAGAMLLVLPLVLLVRRPNAQAAAPVVVE